MFFVPRTYIDTYIQSEYFEEILDVLHSNARMKMFNQLLTFFEHGVLYLDRIGCCEGLPWWRGLKIIEITPGSYPDVHSTIEIWRCQPSDRGILTQRWHAFVDGYFKSTRSTGNQLQ